MPLFKTAKFADSAFLAGHKKIRYGDGAGAA
jgi:hypothetical protein